MICTELFSIESVILKKNLQTSWFISTTYYANNIQEFVVEKVEH